MANVANNWMEVDRSVNEAKGARPSNRASGIGQHREITLFVAMRSQGGTTEPKELPRTMSLSTRPHPPL
jgi:hypothetical protein